MGQYETSTAMKEIGVISEKISPEAAITKLMYLLQQDIAPRSLNHFETFDELKVSF
jgi:L-asparaginase